MAINIFSDFKTNEKIQVSHFRRVRHSASDKMTSMWKHKGDAVKFLVDEGNTAAGVMATAATVAAVAGSTAAFAAAMSGPQAGIALGVIGIVLLVKSKYSNREAAHKKLSGFVWSFIDDEAPRKPSQIELMDIAAAALSLLIEGEAQYDIMQKKLSASAKEYEKFLGKYKGITRTDGLKTPINLGTPTLGAPNLTFGKIVLEDDNSYKLRMLEWEYRFIKAEEFFNKACEPGGAIFDYLRRLNHFGNYLQAPMIISQSLMDNAHIDMWSNDQIKRMPNAEPLRKTVTDLAEYVNTLEDNRRNFNNNPAVHIALQTP